MARSSSYSVNTNYLKHNRGIAKIIEIILGFVLCSMLCGVWYGGRGCFYNGQIGFASGVNFVFLVANIVFFILNVLDVLKDLDKFEKIYAVVGAVFFLLASLAILYVVFIMEEFHNWDHIVSAVMIVFVFALFVFEVRVFQGRA